MRKYHLLVTCIGRSVRCNSFPISVEDIDGKPNIKGALAAARWIMRWRVLRKCRNPKLQYRFRLCEDICEVEDIPE